MQRPSFGDAKGRNMAETFVKLEHSSEEVLMPHPSLEAPPEASRSNSSSELSELEESDFDAAPVAFGDTAETFVESESSSDDVKEHQRYREIEAKNTWALSDSEESDSMVSNTSEDSSYSSGTESEASDFSHGIKTGEIESDVHDALDEESLDEISGRAYDPKPRAAPNRDQGAPSVRRRLSSQASKSPTQNSSFSNIRLSPHDPELFTIAFKCLKDERRFQVGSNPCTPYGRNVPFRLL